tara:strand:- start:1759 stop:2580 length:822 start_codon:yes stop_codon:yes gene_type:complete
MAEEADVVKPDVETPAIEPDPIPEGQYVNGEFVSNSELRDGYMRNSTFTQKSQQAAADRKEAEIATATAAQATSDANARVALADSREAAITADKAWYSSHPQEEWAGYKPEIDSVSMTASTVPAVAVTPSATEAKLDKIIEQNDKDAAAKRQTALENRVDAVLNEVDRVRKVDFPLADVDMVQAKIEAHQSLNGGRLPSNLEITQFSKQIHDKFVKSGARVPLNTVETDSTKPDVVPGNASPAISSRHTEIDLNKDPDEAERALKDYMASKLG